MGKKISTSYLKNNIVATHSISRDKFHGKFHLHDQYEIYFLLSGDVNLFVNNACYHLEKGNMLFFNKTDIHKAVTISNDIPYERITIHFNPSIISDIPLAKTDLLSCFEDKGKDGQRIVLLDLNQSDYFTNTAIKMIQKLDKGDYGSDILPLTYLIQILYMINDLYFNKRQSLKNTMSDKIQATVEYIDDHLTDNLSLDMISEDLSISKYHLCHTFKENTGTTIYQYIIVRRIALAKKLLLSGKSVTEACHESGFNDYSNFIRTFKKETGVSPGNFGKY